MKALFFGILILMTSCSSVLERREIVELTYIVTRSGAPNNIRVLSTSNEDFNQTAIESVKRWRFNNISTGSSRHVVKLDFQPEAK